MSLLPRSPEVASDAGPRVIGVDSEDADALMSALSSETARRMLSELHDDPAPPAELADRVDTTLQNAQYHLEKLEDAGAIEVVGTAYSEKGREMDVYAPADQPLVIFAGHDESASGLRAALSRLLGGFAALALGALVVQELFGQRSLASFLPLGRTGGGDGGGAGGGDGSSDGGDGDGMDAAGDGGDGGGAATETATPAETGATGTPRDTAGTETPAGTPTAEPTATTTPTEGASPTPSPEPSGTPTPAPEPTPTPMPTGEPTPVATETATPVATGTPTPTEAPGNVTATTAEFARTTAEAAGGGLPPGLVFFLGGALVLTVGIAVTYARR